MAERRFRAGWKMSLFVALFLPILLSLGFWQLNRAEEKRHLEDEILDRIGALPAPPGARVRDFERVRLAGAFEPEHSFLLDNQTHDGVVGFAVITSFLGDDGRRWLVHRGYLAGDPGRRALPEVRTPSGHLTLVGLVWPEFGLLPVYGANDWPTGWPKVVQRLEVERMAAMLDNAVPREIRLEAGQPGVFAAAETNLNMPAAKHTGYAVQWFGLAIVLIGGYLYFGLRPRDVSP